MAQQGKRERDPNTQQLRGTIQSGRTPSIDSAHEPAMASFDTDDEAAGRPAQAAAIKQAMAHEGRASAQTTSGGTKSGLRAPLLILVAVAVAAVLGWILLS